MLWVKLWIIGNALRSKSAYISLSLADHGSAISPTYPFNKLTYLRIDALLGPVFLASIFINYYMVYKGIGLAIGFAIFGDPILTPGLKWLNRNYPSWPQLLEPKK